MDGVFMMTTFMVLVLRVIRQDIIQLNGTVQRDQIQSQYLTERSRMIEHVTRYEFLTGIIVFNICLFLICVAGVLLHKDFIFGEDEEE